MTLTLSKKDEKQVRMAPILSKKDEKTGQIHDIKHNHVKK
mgnify:FL=1